MSVDLIKKWITVTKSTQGASSQIVKEKDIIVPDGMTDVKKILLLDGKIRMDHIDIQANKLMYKGQIDVIILYVPEGINNSVVKMNGSIMLDDFMIVEGLEPSDRVNFNYDIENIHDTILNERKINIKAIIALDVDVISTKEVYMIEDVKTEEIVQKKTEEIDIITMVPYKEEKKPLKEELTIPQNKPIIGEILKQTMKIKEEQIKRTDEEIIFNCIVEVSTMYKSAEDENNLEVVSYKIPFNGNIELIRDDNEAYISCELEVIPTYTEIKPDYDGEDRIIGIECFVNAKYATYNNELSEVVNDIYCPGKKVTISGDNESYQNLVFKDTVDFPKKVNLNAEGLSPENNKIFDAEMVAKIDDKILNGNIMTVEGFVEIKVTYITEDGANKIGVLEDAVPFEIELSTTVNKGDYTNKIEVLVKDVNVVNFSKDNITLDYNLECDINIYDKKELKIIDDIILEDMTKEELSEYPSIIVYTVKSGENLWEIAKRFNTTVDDISEVNEFEKDAKLKGGEKVIIIKKTKTKF
ncbi:hypothetical protein AN642_00240 [Epulopiscium sp. SCG-B10WGA-EpuloA2]|nr:hypothetical protein AN642_00240 [Epulopiscium sp. SCG-B10WGA-EpuloA2]